MKCDIGLKWVKDPFKLLRWRNSAAKQRSTPAIIVMFMLSTRVIFKANLTTTGWSAESNKIIQITLNYCLGNTFFSFLQDRDKDDGFINIIHRKRRPCSTPQVQNPNKTNTKCDRPGRLLKVLYTLNLHPVFRKQRKQIRCPVWILDDAKQRNHFIRNILGLMHSKQCMVNNYVESKERLFLRQISSMELFLKIVNS